MSVPIFSVLFEATMQKNFFEKFYFYKFWFLIISLKYRKLLLFKTLLLEANEI